MFDLNITAYMEKEDVPYSALDQKPYDNGMIGKYVLVRCKDAGVHCGVLVSHHNRECVLKFARRLWKWVPAKGQNFLSGVAVEGITDGSKVGAVLERIHLTENCEIAMCTERAQKSLSEFPVDEN